jgi:hypothetical protein
MNKKQLAIVLLIIGVVGFIYQQNQKKKYRVFEKRISNNNEFVHSINVQSGNNYLFSLWGNDEEGGLQWAGMEMYFKIITESGVIVEEKNIVATGTEDDTGKKRATNGDDVKFSAAKSESISLFATLVNGDYMDIEIYENLPENNYWLPVLFIGIFITGLILYLKSRNQ